MWRRKKRQGRGRERRGIVMSERLRKEGIIWNGVLRFWWGCEEKLKGEFAESVWYLIYRESILGNICILLLVTLKHDKTIPVGISLMCSLHTHILMSSRYRCLSLRFSDSNRRVLGITGCEWGEWGCWDIESFLKREEDFRITCRIVFKRSLVNFRVGIKISEVPFGVSIDLFYRRCHEQLGLGLENLIWLEYSHWLSRTWRSLCLPQ